MRPRFAMIAGALLAVVLPAAGCGGSGEDKGKESEAAYKNEVEQAGYAILFDEKEEDDAEISYKGSGRTGQIALRNDCVEEDTIRVHITNRPA